MFCAILGYLQQRDWPGPWVWLCYHEHYWGSWQSHWDVQPLCKLVSVLSFLCSSPELKQNCNPLNLKAPILCIPWCSESPGRGFEAASPQILRGKGLPRFFLSPDPTHVGASGTGSALMLLLYMEIELPWEVQNLRWPYISSHGEEAVLLVSSHFIWWLRSKGHVCLPL